MEMFNAFIGILQLYVSVLDLNGKKNVDNYEKNKIIDLILSLEVAISKTIQKLNGDNSISNQSVSDLWDIVSRNASLLKEPEFQILAQQSFEKSLYWMSENQNIEGTFLKIKVASISMMNKQLTKIRMKLSK
jgi:hypothetical protein